MKIVVEDNFGFGIRAGTARVFRDYAETLLDDFEYVVAKLDLDALPNS